MDDKWEATSYTFTTSLKASDFESYEKAKLTFQDWLHLFFIWIGTSVCALIVVGVTSTFTGEKTLAFVSGILFWLLLGIAFRSMTKARYAKAASDTISYEMILDRIGVTQKVGRTETKFFWSEIEAIEKTADMIEIKTWNEIAFLIPKHAFKSEADYHSCFHFASDMKSSVPVGHA